MKPFKIVTLIVAATLVWGGIGYAGWRTLPPLLFTGSCDATACDPTIGILVRYGGPVFGQIGIDMLVTVAGDDDSPYEAVGRAWLELARYREQDPALTKDYFPDMPLEQYYENAVLFGNDEAANWQAENGDTEKPSKKWGETFGNWSAALTTDHDLATCYITSEYDITLGGDDSRDTNLTFFTRAPEWDHPQLQYNAGIVVSPDHPAQLTFSEPGEAVEGRTTGEPNEHILFGERDPALLRRAMMAKSASITITLADGSVITDTIMLDGLAAAYADMANVCGIKLPDPDAAGATASNG